MQKRQKKKGIHVYHLNIGQPDLETPDVMRHRLKNFDSTVIAYTPSVGTNEYLDSMIDYYGKIGFTLGRCQIIATTGGSEAILFSFLAVANNGDEILLVEPFYTNYRAFAVMAGVTLVPIETKVEDGFHLPSISEWEKALTPKTKAVIICNPNNPTGTVYSPEELEMVVSFCKKHSLFLISDEAYREFVYDSRPYKSALGVNSYDEGIIIVDSLSKRYSACGIRLGTLVTKNEEIYQACSRMAQGRLSPPGLAQFIASGASLLTNDYFEGIKTEYQKRRDILYKGLSEIPGVFLLKPEGAFYFVARLPVPDGEEFAKWLLSDFQYRGATVMVSPAEGFYATKGLGLNEVRIAYVLNSSDLLMAVEVLSEALRVYPHKIAIN